VSTWKLIRLTIAAAILALLCGGCIIVPTPAMGHGMISQSSIDDIKPGVTTREDILINFGDPTTRLLNDTVFQYAWEEFHGFYGWGFPGIGGGAGPIGGWYTLVVYFDDNGRVKYVEERKR